MSIKRRMKRLVAAAGVTAVVAGVTGPLAAAPAKADVTTGVYIVSVGGGPVSSLLSGLETTVANLGGQNLTDLPISGSFAVALPTALAPVVQALPGVVSVVPNEQVLFASAGSAADATSTALPVNNFLADTGAASLRAAGDTGQGVTVAVLDSGVSPVSDLAGRLIEGPDLTMTGTVNDNVGHGTAMAGLIAGSGANSPDAAHNYAGVAPGARVVAVKTANADGETDMVTILRGLSWIASHAAQYNIRVVNLSLGALATAAPAMQPVDVAAERLWQMGIVVVAAAGNAGNSTGTITVPGSDPTVLTVGAYDENFNSSPSDDVIPAWSSEGPTAQGVAKPDVVVPGRTLVTLGAPGSAAVTQNPQALVGNGYIKGSGTSEATAVTSGVVALLLQQHPTWTPDQVKQALTGTANPIPGVARIAQGNGRVNAAAANVSLVGAPLQQNLLASLLTGLLPSIPNLFDWNGGTWTGSSWAGSSWAGSSWAGSSWAGSSWAGSSWAGSSWAGSSWAGSSWAGSSWAGSSWAGSSWAGSSWAGSSWAGSSWASQAYGDGSDDAPQGG